MKDFMRFEYLQRGAAHHLIGAVLIFVLLVILHQVLRDAVRQGASLKVSHSERVETIWRCNAAHGPREREDCIARRTDAIERGANQIVATAEMRKP